MVAATEIGLQDVQEAAAFLRPHIRQTPMLHALTLSQRRGVEVYLKAESLQRTGSFKVRGALNMLRTLTPDQLSRGVVAASAGNHAQGVAVAATTFGTRARVYMPLEAPLAKVRGAEENGAEVHLRGESLTEALAAARDDSHRTGAIFVPPFDDRRIVGGQGTLCLEILEECPAPELVLVPVGGGGLISGVALAIKQLSPATRIVGVQAHAAGGAASALHEGSLVKEAPLQTIADGIAVAGPSELTLRLMQQYVDDIVCVSEEAIPQAVVTLIEKSKLVVEPAGAVGVAALEEGSVRPEGTTVVLLSGGNIDITLLGRIVEHGLTSAGRIRILRLRMHDRPGQLARVLRCLSETRANVLDIQHRRSGIDLPLGVVEVDLQVETRGLDHDERIAADLQAQGFERAPGNDLVQTFSARPR